VNRRLRDANHFFYDPQGGDTILIPFKTDTSLTRKLLEQAAGIRISHTVRMPGEIKTLYGQPTDSLYKQMMQESDNFLAEQLLLAVSGMLSDTINGSHAREHVLREILGGLPQPPVWADGSGLSRYNLFSPGDMVYVLTKLYHEIPEDRLLGFFAAGGISGTIRDWYGGDEGPYVFAKTGTLAERLPPDPIGKTADLQFYAQSFPRTAGSNQAGDAGDIGKTEGYLLNGCQTASLFIENSMQGCILQKDNGLCIADLAAG